MPDATVRIEGVVASDPRFNTTPNGTGVANLRILAGRSKKNEQGGWDTLSTTAYDASFWNEHAQLVDALRPEKGSKVVVTGTITTVESYQGNNGESLSVKVNGDGLRVFPKRDQQQSNGNLGGSQQSGQWGSNPQQAQQTSDPWAASSQGFSNGNPDEVPF